MWNGYGCWRKSGNSEVNHTKKDSRIMRDSGRIGTDSVDTEGIVADGSCHRDRKRNDRGYRPVHERGLVEQVDGTSPAQLNVT